MRPRKTAPLVSRPSLVVLFVFLCAICLPLASCQSAPESGRPLAIQIGTTTRRVVAWTNGTLESVPLDPDKLTLSSIISKHHLSYQEHPILQDAEIPSTIGQWFQAPDVNATIGVPLDGQIRGLTIREAYAMTFREMKEAAETHFNETFREAVVTIPHRFNDDQRQLVHDAAGDAGLSPLRLLHESTAAALAHGLGEYPDCDEAIILAYNLDGDDAFTIEVLECDMGVFDMLASLPQIPYGPNPQSPDLLIRTLSAVNMALSDLNLSTSAVHHLVPIGSSPRLPPIQAVLESYLGLKASSKPQPASAAISGAASLARILSDDDDLDPGGCPCIEIQPLSLGYESPGGIMATLIPRHTIVPTYKHRLVLPAHHNQSTVRLRVYMGERALVADNIFVGELEVDVVPPLDWREHGRVDVGLELGPDRTVEARITDLKTGVEVRRVLGRIDALSAFPVDDMILAAETFQEQDDAVRSLAGYLPRVGGRVAT